MTAAPGSPAGGVIWLTGLSGVGKTATGTALVERIRADGTSCVLLDGDAVRDAVRDASLGHDRESRLLNAYRISRLSRMLARQDVLVVVSTMSLFHEIHAWNRRNLPAYFEVLLEAHLAVLKQRDPKGLYRRAAAGDESHVAGVNLEYEAPKHPDLRVRTDAAATGVEAVAEQIRLAWQARGAQGSPA